MKKTIKKITLLLILINTPLLATIKINHTGCMGVIGEHTHKKGDWMISYRYMKMNMDGNREGQQNISTQKIFENYRIAPNRMETNMHMLSTMWGFSEHVTLMLMVPYLQKNMIALHQQQGKFNTQTEGLGDITLKAFHTLKKTKKTTLFLINGLRFPTGGIEEKDTVFNQKVQLPYRMQLGSGSTDYILGATWTQIEEEYAIGAQIKSIFRMNKNNRNYQLGNTFEGTTWITKSLSPILSGCMKLQAKHQEDISGYDNEIETTAQVNPLANTQQGFSIVNLGLGLSWTGTESYKTHRIALEWNIPIYQKVNGIQMNSEQTLTIGWQHLLN